MLGQKFDEALQLASELHREQTRKATSIPYMAHLMAVAGIVMEAHAYHQFDNIEDIAIGALLHDAIEDQGHRINLEEIRTRFGARVHDIVRDCSDAIIEEEGQTKAPWRQRKEAYIEHVKHKSIETQIVSCADKLHNARSILFDYSKIGDAIWDRFNPTKEDTLWYYDALADGFSEAWPENPLLPDFRAAVERMRKAVHQALCPIAPRHVSGDLRQSMYFQSVSTNIPSEVHNMFMVGEIQCLSLLRDFTQEAQRCGCPRVVEGLHDVICDEGKRRSARSILTIASETQRQIELEPRPL